MSTVVAAQTTEEQAVTDQKAHETKLVAAVLVAVGMVLDKFADQPNLTGMKGLEALKAALKKLHDSGRGRVALKFLDLFGPSFTEVFKEEKGASVAGAGTGAGKGTVTSPASDETDTDKDKKAEDVKDKDNTEAEQKLALSLYSFLEFVREEFIIKPKMTGMGVSGFQAGFDTFTLLLYTNGAKMVLEFLDLTGPKLDEFWSKFE